jgi:hypothetical protein
MVEGVKVGFDGGAAGEGGEGKRGKDSDQSGAQRRLAGLAKSHFFF